MCSPSVDGPVPRIIPAVGDGDALCKLVEGHAGLVYTAALRIMGDRGLAEDVMQSVFAALARSTRVATPRPMAAG